MNEILKLEFLTEINYIRVFIDIILLFISSKFIEYTYITYAYSNDNKKLFTRHMFNFLLAIFLIVTVIKSSIALSLGLVGALSIIRFRTAIKEPGQLISLLILTALAISMAAEKEILGIIITLIYYLNFIIRKDKSNNELIDSKIVRVTIENAENNFSIFLNEETFSRMYKDVNSLLHVEFEISSDKKEIESLIKKLNDNYIITSYEII